MSDSSDRSKDVVPSTPKPTVAQLEAEIAVTRARLATTVDELVTRAQPKEIARRQGENARLAFIDATHTQYGTLRVERIASVVGALVAVVVLIGLLRRRRG
ncbi:DUF3618 domain-containing protein [Lapillicoccus sp.]|uniref:DUF3618 domain-containing protein n=1 Tax=Lapillicoccus sp. TaxID=1909287 RepID=UPI0025F97462|nr:DUF3618 domain-containing protein [Lapillicoccus sp.]